METTTSSSDHTRALKQFKRKLWTYNNDRTRDYSELETLILADIFLRLPPETVVACKVACKKWNQLTKDPHFFIPQLERSQYRILIQRILVKGTRFEVNPFFLVDESNNTLREMPTPVGEFRIMSARDGILSIRFSEKKVDPLGLFNPMNGTHVMLPVSEPQRVFSSYVVTFGFDKPSGKYLVVRHSRFNRGTKESWFEMLTLGSDSYWRRIPCPLTLGHAYRAVFCAGGCFFQFIQKQAVNNSWVWSIRIAILDSTEKIVIFPFPRTFGSEPFVEMLDVGGCLTFIEHDKAVMRKWILEITRDRGLSIVLKDTYDTGFRWTRGVYYETLRQIADHSYLQRITSCKGDADRLTRCAPDAEDRYTDLLIPDLPCQFNAISFKPSFLDIAAICACN